MNTEDNKEIVRRFVEEVQSNHRIELIDELLSPGYIDHYDGAQPPYLETAKKFFAMIFSAFPDVTATIQEQTAQGGEMTVYLSSMLRFPGQELCRS
jgi:predicted SnoaL-like aldol condensation-catalyzing enzyme